MPKIPGANHRQAVRALKKFGFNIVREGRKHICYVRWNSFHHHPKK